MRQLLMTLIVLFLASGAIMGFLFFRQEAPMADYNEPIAAVEPEEPAEETIEEVPEEPQEEPAEESAEEPAQETQEEPEEPAQTKPAKKKKKRKYYRFSVGTQRDNQNVRSEPNGRILYNVPKGSSGYIVVFDDEWSLVEIKGDIAYMATRYLQLEEISKSEFPKKLRKLTTADAGKKVSL